MDCKLVHETVHVNEIVFEGSSEQSVDIDVVLPDYCPDIGKILKCQVIPRILSKENTSDKLIVEASALVRIFYADDEQKCVRSFEQEFPFSKEFGIKSGGDNVSAAVKAKTDYVNCRAVNQRKLDIHGAITVSACVTADQVQDIVSNVCGAGVNLKKQSLPTSCLVGAAQQQFTISETLEISSSKPPAGSIVRSEAAVFSTEHKAIANKLILKGEAVVRMLYRNDLEEDKLDTMEFNVPVNQIIDVSGIDDMCSCDVALDVVSLKLVPRADSDGEYKMVTMDLRVNCTVKAFAEKEVELISDAYSTEYDLDMDVRNIRLEKMLKNVSDNYMVKDTMEMKSSNISKITDVWCDLNEVTPAVSEGKLFIKGVATFSILAVNEGGEAVFFDKASNFEYDCAVCDSEVLARAEARGCIISVSYSFISEDKLELRAQLKLVSPVYSVKDNRSIISVAPDENKKKSLSQLPSVTIYYANKGEELWNIARTHNSSVERIVKENDLSEEVLAENKMLLISI